MRAVHVAQALAAPPSLFPLSSKFMTILCRVPSVQQVLSAAKLVERVSKDHAHVAVRACGLQ